MNSKNDAIQSKCESTQYVAGGRLIDSATKTSSTVVHTERDPLLLRVSNFKLYSGNTQAIIRARRKSPETVHQNYHIQHRYHSGESQQVMWSGTPQPSRESRSDPPSLTQLQVHSDSAFNNTDSTYEIYIENDNASRRMIRSGCSDNSHRPQQIRRGSKQFTADKVHQNYNTKTNRDILGTQTSHDPQLLDIPTEIFAVRRAALTVFHPLTYTWVIVSVGFGITAALGMALWTGLLPTITLWLILLPCWLSHTGLFICHVLSARALSVFIAEANDNRQRQDSTDHLDRTEYLPLLQISLRYFVKTSLISVCIFVLEILIYLRLTRGAVTLTTALTPMWIIVAGGIIDGIICKTQNIVRLSCWLLVLVYMSLLVLRVDHMYELKWLVIIGPVITLLGIFVASLVYILYGHKIGYFRLTQSQQTAGILYSMGTIVCIILLVIFVEIHLTRPVNVEMRVIMVALVPLVVSLVGLGSYAVNRDELERLLQHGGQAAIHPMKLVFESSGWTAVETKGVTYLPMFGEVRYESLKAEYKSCSFIYYCCACYPYEEDDGAKHLHETYADLPYLTSQSSHRRLCSNLSKRIT